MPTSGITMSILRFGLHAVDSLSKYSGIIIAFVILPIFVLVFAEVIARYVFNSPTTWSSILTQFIFGGYFVLGGAYCLLFGGHVKVDIVYARFAARKRAIIDLITSAVLFAFAIVLLWYSVPRCWISTMRNETTGMAWDVIKWPYMWTLPIATFLMTLQGLAKFVRDLHLAITGKQLL